MVWMMELEPKQGSLFLLVDPFFGQDRIQAACFFFLRRLQKPFNLYPHDLLPKPHTELISDFYIGARFGLGPIDGDPPLVGHFLGKGPPFDQT